ncbi:MAG: nucleotidyltransferase family protein [Alphaproteobacteria bacterium]|nr:nucleotidyltransferase family protein [Alphaproteobacteria bacterium]
MRAMVLAAGLGSRLQPLTHHQPKPLVTVAGRPMLEYILRALRHYGVAEVILNSHHLAQQLHDYMATAGADILGEIPYRLLYEPTILETGGGVKNALPWLGDGPFFVINGDSFWDEQNLLARLADGFDSATMGALLVMVPPQRVVASSVGAGDFIAMADHGAVSNDNRGNPRRGDASHDHKNNDGPVAIRRVGAGNMIGDKTGSKMIATDYRPEVFCGIQLLTAQPFGSVKDDIFSLNVIYDQLIAGGVQQPDDRQDKKGLYGLSLRGQFFTVGTMADKLLVEQALGFG